MNVNEARAALTKFLDDAPQLSIGVNQLAALRGLRDQMVPDSSEVLEAKIEDLTNRLRVAETSGKTLALALTQDDVRHLGFELEKAKKQLEALRVELDQSRQARAIAINCMKAAMADTDAANLEVACLWNRVRDSEASRDQLSDRVRELVNGKAAESRSAQKDSAEVDRLRGANAEMARRNRVLRATLTNIRNEVASAFGTVPALEKPE